MKQGFILYFILGGFTILCFQNCSSPNSQGVNATIEVASELNPESPTGGQQGNGDAYTGKFGYASFFAKNQDWPCNDSMDYFAAIVHRPGEGFFLVKDNCEFIAPKKLNETDIRIETSVTTEDAYLIYKNITFARSEAMRCIDDTADLWNEMFYANTRYMDKLSNFNGLIAACNGDQACINKHYQEVDELYDQAGAASDNYYGSVCIDEYESKYAGWYHPDFQAP